MGREVWIYKLKNEQVKNGLQRLSSNEFGFNYTFENSIKDRQTVDVLNFLNKENNTVTPELLFEITYWLSEQIGLQDIEKDLFLNSELGISQIFESNTKSEANSFMIAYYNYLDSIEQSESSCKFFDSGIVTNTEAFLEFLNFFILLLNKINTLKNEPNKYTQEMNNEVNAAKKEKNADTGFKDILNSEFKLFRSLYESTFENEQSSDLNNYPEFELIIRNFELLSKAIEMKRQIKNESMHNTIVLIDSK
ncbi:MAG: hypothetical protein R2792_14730 [Saprospiraceae bacterium]